MPYTRRKLRKVSSLRWFRFGKQWNDPAVMNEDTTKRKNENLVLLGISIIIVSSDVSLWVGQDEVTEPEKWCMAKTFPFHIPPPPLPKTLRFFRLFFSLVQGEKKTTSRTKRWDDGDQPEKRDGKMEGGQRALYGGWAMNLFYKLWVPKFYLSWALAFVDLPLRFRKTSSCRIRF